VLTLYVALILHQSDDLKQARLPRAVRGSFVFLLNETCPHSWVATGYYDQIVANYARKAKFTAVINSDQAGLVRWRNRFKPSYPVLTDPKAALIHKLGGVSAPTVLQVDPRGMVTRRWVGLSKELLKQINVAVAASCKVSASGLKLEGAPATTQTGCLF
jgi:hypothetical protein